MLLSHDYYTPDRQQFIVEDISFYFLSRRVACYLATGRWESLTPFPTRHWCILGRWRGGWRYVLVPLSDKRSRTTRIEG